MEIKINGSAADITIENEKTVGGIIAGIDDWLVNSGHRVSGISVDGEAVGASTLDEIFSRNIDKIKTIEIFTSSIADLAVESIESLYNDAKEFDKLNFEERDSFLNKWKESPQAVFASEQMSDLYNLYVNSFSGGEINSAALISITEERLREVKDPVSEISNLKQIVEETCSCLNNLALDIQTGKDLRAAQTIQIFTAVAEKILRILRQMDIQGYLLQKAVSADNTQKPFKFLVIEFGNIVKNLLEAYEKNDTVLVGDIAEYEASVKLQELYAAIINNKSEQAQTQETK